MAEKVFSIWRQKAEALRERYQSVEVRARASGFPKQIHSPAWNGQEALRNRYHAAVSQIRVLTQAAAKLLSENPLVAQAVGISQKTRSEPNVESRWIKALHDVFNISPCDHTER